MTGRGLARPPGCVVRGCRCPGVAARWPYPALRRFNPFGIGTKAGALLGERRGPGVVAAGLTPRCGALIPSG